MNKDKLLFSLKTIDKQGNIKDIKNNLTVLEIENLTREINNKVYDYEIKLEKKIKIKKLKY